MAKIVTYIELETPAWDVTSPMGPDITWRFAQDTEYLDRNIECIPSVLSVTYSAATISLGEDLGQRATLSVTLRDHRHQMGGEAFDSGTFWGKWRARYGQKLRGRDIRLIRGFAGQALDQMETRHFFVDTTDGPTPDGVYTIVAKDLLKFADGDRAVAPRLSNGRLAGSIDADDVSIVLQPTGIGDIEYPASDFYVCVGGNEIVHCSTRTGDTLTVTRGELGSPPNTHSAGDRAQLVLWYDGDDPADIIYDLFATYGGMPTECLPLAEWQEETANNLAGILYARAITEPTPVTKLVSELVQNAALAVWYDERARVVRLQVLREIATNAAMIDEDAILQGSLRVRDQPSKRMSQVWTYYAQRNPADRGDNEDNYRSALAVVDLVAQTDYGGLALKTVIGKWLPTEAAAERCGDIHLSRFRDPPRQFTFDLLQGGAVSVAPAGGYRLVWRANQDIDGNVVETGAPIQVTRVSVEPGVIHVEAEEMLASGVVVVTNVVVLTQTGPGQTWTVPADWNDADNSIHVIGGGGRGADAPGGPRGAPGAGGGAGAYSGIENLSLTPAASISYRVGTGGTSSTPTGGDTWFNGANLAGSSVGAKGGTGATAGVGGTGGASASGVGATKTSGGNGGDGVAINQDYNGGGGGGGAGGPNGNGRNGGSTFNVNGGGGGGGANGGTSGGPPTGTGGATGGLGGHNRFGFGGGSSSQPAGQEGGGGKGGDQSGSAAGQSGGVGGLEPIWTQTIAPIIAAGPGGGGGGGGANGGDGGNGGLYGGGGGGGGGGGDGGDGAQGVIVIVWRPEEEE